jgi:glycosyltransferase involved in cell wall biosynthesis
MSTAEALARHGSRPYRLYADRAAVTSLQSELRRLNAPPNREVFPSFRLADHLAADPPLVLHSTSSDLHPLAAARSRFASAVVPITAMQYSISQIHIRHMSFLHAFFADLYPCDAALCTTPASRQAQINIFAHLADALEPFLGKRDLPLRHEVIPYPVDTDYFHPLPPSEKRAARQTLGLPLEGRIVLYVGRFDPASKSDLHPLLLAFRNALRRLNEPKDVHLVLAGYDPSGEVPYLRKLAGEFGLGDRLHLHTDYPPSQQAAYYQAADVFVSLSDTLQENFGLTPVEAMACGLPAIVSDWAGYQATVEHEVTGFRVSSPWLPEDADLAGVTGFLPWAETHLPLSQSVLADVGEAADRLALLLENEALRQRMGEAGRKVVLDRYAAPVIVARMEALWEELSGIARGCEKRPAPEASLYEARYGKELLPYASHCLPSDARLVLTEYGREVLSGMLSLPLTETLERYYDREALNGLMAVLKAGSLMNRGLPLRETASQSSRKYGLPQPSAVRHLTWLVKHGLAALK